MNSAARRSAYVLAIAIGLNLAACGKKAPTGQAALIEAEQAVAKGDFAAASIHIKNALQSNPEDAASRLALGRINLKMGEFGLAESELRKALSSGADQNQVVPLLLETLSMLGLHQKVIDESAKAKLSDPKLQSLAFAYAARGQFGLKKIEEAKKSFAQALQLDPDSAVARVGNIAVSLATDADVPAVKPALNDLLTKMPNSQEAWAMAGFVARLEGRFADAKTALSKAVELKPYDGEQRAALITTLIDLRDYVGADTQIQQMAKISPKSFYVTYLVALNNFRQGNYREARDNIQRVAELATGFQPALELAAETAIQTGELSLAEKYSKALIEKNPEGVVGHRLLGATYLALNQPERAVATLQPFVQSKNPSPQILALMGDALIRTGDSKKGVQFLDAAAAAASDSLSMKAFSANAKIAVGDASSGLKQLEEIAGKSAGSKLDLSIAQALMGAKQYDKAAAIVIRYVQAQPNDPAGRHALGMVYLAQGKRAEAEKYFAEALALNNGYLPTLQVLGELDLSSGKVDVAKKRYAAIVAADPKNVAALLALASLNVRAAGPEPETLAYFKQAREANPGSALAAIDQASYYIQTSQAEAAVALLETYVQSLPNDSQLAEALASAYDASGNLAKAIQVLEKQLAANSLSGALNYRIGSLRLRLQDFAGAMKNFERASELQPNAIEPKASIAGTLFNSGKRDQAMAAAKAIQTANPSNPIGSLLVGDFLGLQGNASEAVTQYKQAYSITKASNTAFKLYLGLLQNKNTAEAAQFLRDHWASSPSDIAFMLQASEVLLEKKEWKEAVAVLNQVLKVNKDSPAALNNAAVAMHQLKEPRAIELAQRAYQIEPNNASIQDTLGFISLEQGKLDQALTLLKDASTKAPRNAEIRLHYAQALAKRGDSVGSKAQASDALKNNPSPDVKAGAEALLK
jgi:putative PEP-CTERM system TPR-repeat lipoprotein